MPAMIASSFIIFVLIFRIISITYIDFFGPVYAAQLYRHIGGIGSPMPFLALSVLTFLLALSIIFRPKKLQQVLALPLVSPPYAMLGSKIFFLFLSIFTFLLYADMVWIGHIPFVEKMERYDYARLYAGSLHHIIIDYGFLLAGMLGTFFIYPRLTGRGYHYRYIAILSFFFCYFALSGHRFSAFYSHVCFFGLPYAAACMLKERRELPPLPHSRTQRIMGRKSTWLIIVLAVFAMLCLVIFNSMVRVRGYDDPVGMLVQRILIQPGELWWVTWDRLFQYWNWTPDLAWELMFKNPFDTTRNSTIQYLMIKAIGYERATAVLALGSQYAGGYPEVLFELFGVFAALPIAFLFGLITALVLRAIVLAVCRGYFGTVFMGIYVYYGFTLLYIGGMLNFLLVMTFWLKIALFAVVYWVELTLCKQQRRRVAKRMFNYQPRAVQG